MTTLPLQLEPDPDDADCALPYLEGTIDGRPYRFLLDTGAGKTNVATDAYVSSLPVVGERQSRGAFNVTHTQELVKISSLTVGPITTTNLTVVRSTLEGWPSILGMDVLGEMALAIDFDGGEVRFAPGGSLPALWPLRRSPNGQPHLDLEFPHTTALACWDTGAAVTCINADFIAANPELFVPQGVSIGHDPSGASQETPMYQMADVKAGGITIAAHKVAAVPLPQEPMRMDMVLGYPAIRQFTWTMDFPRDRWTATRREC